MTAAGVVNPIPWSGYKTIEVLRLYRQFAGDGITHAQKKWKRTDYELALDEFLDNTSVETILKAADLLGVFASANSPKELLETIRTRKPAPSVQELDEMSLIELVDLAVERQVCMNNCYYRENILSLLVKLFHPQEGRKKISHDTIPAKVEARPEKVLEKQNLIVKMRRSTSGRIRVGERLDEVDPELYAFILAARSGTWSKVRQYLPVCGYTSFEKMNRFDFFIPRVERNSCLVALSLLHHVYPTLRKDDVGAVELIERARAMIGNDRCALPGVGMCETIRAGYEACHDRQLFRLNYLVQELRIESLSDSEMVNMAGTILANLAELKSDSVTSTFRNSIDEYGRNWAFAGFKELGKVWKDYDERNRSRFRAVWSRQLEQVANIVQSSNLLATVIKRCHNQESSELAKLDEQTKALSTVKNAVNAAAEATRRGTGIVHAIVPVLCMLKFQHATMRKTLREDDHDISELPLMPFKLFELKLRALAAINHEATLEQVLSRLLFLEAGHFQNLRDVIGSFHTKLLACKKEETRDLFFTLLDELPSPACTLSPTTLVGHGPLLHFLEGVRQLHSEDHDISFSNLMALFEKTAITIASTEVAAGEHWKDIKTCAGRQADQCYRGIFEIWYMNDEDSSQVCNPVIWASAAQALCQLAEMNPTLGGLQETLQRVREHGEKLLELHRDMRKRLSARPEMSCQDFSKISKPFQHRADEVNHIRNLMKMERSLAYGPLLLSSIGLADRISAHIPPKDGIQGVGISSQPNSEEVEDLLSNNNSGQRRPLLPYVEHVLGRLRTWERILQSAKARL